VGGSEAFCSLAGLAVGDAFGGRILLPGDHPSVLGRQLPSAPWAWSDDTEMACSVFDVLTRHGHLDQEALAANFATHYNPDRGYGAGVARLLLQFRDGDSWRRTAATAFGGQGSWGNGAAMRVAPLGAWMHHDLDLAAYQAELSAVVTHAHPDAVAGAIAVAVAAATAAATPDISGPALLEAVLTKVPPGRVCDGIKTATTLTGADPREAAAALGAGREIAAHDTVPLSLWIAACHLGDYADALWTVAQLAEDVDTVGAIVGGIVAAGTGLAGIPDTWRAACEPLPAWLPHLGL
jgi:ADP-ribosylglycohydrolase